MPVLKYGPYSPSRLDTGICGYAFYHQYVSPDKKNYPESLPQARGSVVHEVYETITREMIANPNRIFNPNEVRQWVIDAINRHPTAYAETSEILDMMRKYIDRPPKTLTTDASIELKLAVKLSPGEFVTDTTTFPGREVQRPVFTECNYDDPDAFARGRADIMMISDDTTKAIIYDHKTQPNIEEANTFQMGFYAWVISKLYPFLDEIHTVLHFARFGSYSDPHVWTKQDLFAIEDEILTRIGILETTQNWTAQPNSKCQYCGLRFSCPVYQEVVQLDENGNYKIKFEKLDILGDTARASWVAGFINVLDQVYDKGKKNLKAHVEMSGPIAIPGKIYQIKSDEKINVDKLNTSEVLTKQFNDILTKHGVNPDNYRAVTNDRLKMIWMLENQQLLKELSDMLPRKTTTRFDGYKA